MNKSIPVFLNRRDLETFLPGLEIVLKIINLLISSWIWLKLLDLVNGKSIWTITQAKFASILLCFDRDSNLKISLLSGQRLKNTSLYDYLRKHY